MIDVMKELGGVKEKTAEALRASEADDGASVVLVAVVREFDSKADKANRMADGDGSPARPSSSWNRLGTVQRQRPRPIRAWVRRPETPCSMRIWPYAS